MQTTDNTFQLVDMPARQLAYVHNVGPYAGNTALFERLFNQVLAWLKQNELFEANMEAISVYHDDPESVSPEQQRISVGFTVPIGTKSEGDIQVMDLPAGKYAVGSFEIDPTDYGPAWEATYKFIGESQLQPAPYGLMYESYKNDPHQHPTGKHLVDICVELNEASIA